MGKMKKPRAKMEISKNSMRFFNAVMIIAFLCTIPQILTTFMTTWRESPPIEYKYMHRGSQHTYNVNKTYYGLYKVIFDEKDTETWTQRVLKMKSKGSEGIQLGNNSQSAGSLSLWTSICPEACRDAIISRIEAYERVAFISLILLCSIVLSSSIVLLSIGWNILFSKNILVLMGCFIISFIINAGSGGYWYYETELSWNLVTNKQQYPYPRCSYSFFIFMTSTCIYAFCFSSLLIIDLVNKSKQKMSHIDKMNIHNRDPINTKGLYQPLFGNQNSMMMQRSASFNNLMPFDKNMNNEFPNFMNYNKMSMDPMGGFSNFKNMPPNMNPNFFPQLSRQYSYSGSPNFQENFQNFGNFSMRNVPSMPDLNFARQYSGMNYNNMNNPFTSQKPYKF